MAEEIYTAERLGFTYSKLLIGFGADHSVVVPTAAIYIPSSPILVHVEIPLDVLAGHAFHRPLHEYATTSLGQEAEREYQRLKKLSGGKEPEQIQVNQEFVDWAKALHPAQPPPQSLADLVTQTR